MTDETLTPTMQQTEDSVRILEGLAAVRVMPGMYVGGTDIRALHHLVYEVVDNSLDEIMAGRGDRVTVIIHDDGSLSVADNGGGIPVGRHAQKGVSALQVVMTNLHAGSKFNDGTTKTAYKVSGGLHGVGVSAVNALSAVMEVQVRREGRVWRQVYNAGIPVTDVEPIRDMASDEHTGTTVRFKPDFTVMDPNEFSFEMLSQRFREMAYVLRGAVIILIDERQKPFPREMTFYFEGGIRSFVRYLNRYREVVHDAVGGVKTVRYSEGQAREDSMEVEFAFQYTDGTSSSTELSFANHINTPDGGTHQTGLRTALTRIINLYARKVGLLKEKDPNFSGRDTLEGLTAIVSIKHPEPQFESQTKNRLINPEVAGAVASVVSDVFSEFLEANPREARRIVEKCSNSMRIRDALEKQRDLLTGRKGLLENTTLPGKLADCSERDPKKCEVFIVEGDSAGGCFVGETMVSLASGLQKSMRELAEDWDNGIQHFGYASNDEGDIRIVPLIAPRLTKTDAELVEVTLDNGEVLRCTPDHLFLLRNGSYQAAAELQPGESLMPLKTRLTGQDELPGIGYEMVWMNGQAQWVHTHHLADLYNLVSKQYSRKAGNTRHHQDFNKRNNDPRNIVRMFWLDHQRLHAELAGEMARRLWSDPEYRTRKIEQLREQAKQQWQDPAYRQYMSERAKVQRQDAQLNEKLLQSFQRWFMALSPDEYVAYCDNMRQMQQRYWSDPAHCREQSERVAQFFHDHPEERETRRRTAVEQWSNAELRRWRAETSRQQWQDESYREQHSADVKAWWSKNPDHSQKIKAALKKRWDDPASRATVETALADWRKRTSSEDKSIAIRNGNRTKALLLLRQIIDAPDLKAEYEQLRLSSARTALSYDRLIREHFAGDENKLKEAVMNINCKVTSVKTLTDTADVYDLTVEGYHNFALASGIFVHNSAKQGRDRHFQAILPLRGKILNTERARLNKILDNNEIKALIAALGVGIGDDFNIGKLRYDRVVMMSVAGDEPTLVMHKSGAVQMVRIGEFIDGCLAGQHNPDDYQVMAFDLHTHETRFRPLKAVIRHPHSEAMYKLTTRYNRSVKVTSSHSVFVLDNGEMKLKKGNEIRPGDTIVASRRLPRATMPSTQPRSIAPSSPRAIDPRPGFTSSNSASAAVLAPVVDQVITDACFDQTEAEQWRFLSEYLNANGMIEPGKLSIGAYDVDQKDRLLYLLGQLGILADGSFDPAGHYLVTISGAAQIQACRPMWQSHDFAFRLTNTESIQGDDAYIRISDDLIGLEVITAEAIDPVGAYVYDFSVQDDENFICGVGGLCAHNTDADQDGAHIRTLMMTFFFRYMQPLIQEGHLYIAQPPIFRLEYKKQGTYFYPEPGMTENDLLAQSMSKYSEPGKVTVSRYKGLGEMNPQQLWETTMDPAHRTLLQVGIEDAAEADQVFSTLMGNEVAPRRWFITTYAKTAKLDV